MKRWVAIVIAIFVLGLLLGASALPASAQQAVVQAVLFFSPTCPHCHIVMDEHLPPLQAQYGDQLEVVEVDVTTLDGQKIYQDYLVRFAVPEERLGVPALVVGDTYMVGSVEIPQFFPTIVAEGLAAGGISWPNLVGVEAYVAEFGLSAGESAEEVSMFDRFSQDLLGNSISVLVLLGLVASAAYLGYGYFNGTVSYGPWPRWVIPVLTLIGIGVSLYLSVIEINHSEAVCGPVGDCNAVQSSTYAYLFGVIPVALLGLIGYVGIAAAWAIENVGPARYKKNAAQVLWWIAFLGTLFSIYLTFLEPFVIGATCAWCLTSALIIALILWAATPDVIQVRKGRAHRAKQKRLRAKGVR